MDGLQMFFNFLIFLIFFVLILMLAYVFTKFISKKSSSLVKGKNISLIESVGFGMDKQIHLIQVGKKYLLISVSGKVVQTLAELSGDDFEENPSERMPQNKEVFGDFFNKYKDLFTKTRKGRLSESLKEDPMVHEEKISKNIGRVKNLKNLFDHTKDKTKDEPINENRPKPF